MDRWSRQVAYTAESENDVLIEGVTPGAAARMYQAHSRGGMISLRGLRGSMLVWQKEESMQKMV